MYSNNRYSVQLTDSKFNFIVNEPVYLVDKTTQDTLWKAYTDNTGKAELWAGFGKKMEKKENLFIVDGSGNKLNSISEFANGLNTIIANKGCGVTNDVDIAFVVDGTGSM